MRDISFISAFPKSGITYLNYMLFHVLFDRPQDAGKIDSDYIFDLHENLKRVPPPGEAPSYVKSHFPYSPGIPLRQRASRAVYLWRDPIDVMMSIWDFKHLLGEDGLLDASPVEEERKFQLFCKQWVTSGGMAYPFAGSWFGNVSSWLDQTDVPTLVVEYRRLKAQPFEELRRILRFFGVEAADERVKQAVEAGRPENMRKLEADEINRGVAGVLYRPGLARGYSRGYRFVGRMHDGSSEKILSTSARQYANQLFGPLADRARSRAADVGVRPAMAVAHANALAGARSRTAGGLTGVNDIFCTYFDHNYLSRALLMIESLQRFDAKKPIYVLTLSELCSQILGQLALPGVEIIPLAALEEAYPELAAVKPTRKTIEYYFTLSPFLPHYLFARTAADRITYLDADLYFFTSPQLLLDSLGEASIAITPHRFSFAYRAHVAFGLFNVGWITYRRCAEALDCLNTYKAECIEWCYDKLENGRFGDQKYLDNWPSRYPSLRVINHKGVNLAIWNVQGHVIRLRNNVIMVDDDPLVFYHYSPTKILPDGSANIPVDAALGGRSKAVVIEHVVNPYKRKLEQEQRLLEQRFPALTPAKGELRYPPGEPLPAYLTEAR